MPKPRRTAKNQVETEILIFDVDGVLVDVRETYWRSAVETLRQTARRLTGNRVEVIEVGELDVGRLLSSGRSLWTDVQAEGIVVFGSSLAQLTGKRSA